MTESSSAATTRAPQRLVVKTLRAGDHWRIDFLGEAFYVRDSKGVRYLLHLVENPGQSFSLDEIAAVGDAEERVDGAREPASLFHDRLRAARAAHGLGDDWPELSRRRCIQDAVARLGVGGRKTPAVDVPAPRMSCERTRKSVAIAIRRTIEAIGRQHALLGAHLEISVRTGASLAYVADPLSGMRWRRDTALDDGARSAILVRSSLRGSAAI